MRECVPSCSRLLSVHLNCCKQPLSVYDWSYCVLRCIILEINLTLWLRKKLYSAFILHILLFASCYKYWLPSLTITIFSIVLMGLQTWSKSYITDPISFSVRENYRLHLEYVPVNKHIPLCFWIMLQRCPTGPSSGYCVCLVLVLRSHSCLHLPHTHLKTGF